MEEEEEHREWTWVVKNVPYGQRDEVQAWLAHAKGDLNECSRAMDIYMPLRLIGHHQVEMDDFLQTVRQGKRWRNHHKKTVDVDDKQDNTSFPMVLVVHGGAWGMGSRAQSNLHQICKTMCRRSNVIVASVGYRLCRFQSTPLYLLVASILLLALLIAWFYPGLSASHRVGWMAIALLCIIMLAILFYVKLTRETNRHPTAVHDLGDAIRWVGENSEHLHIDPKQIILMGHSAGAHLLTTLVTSPVYWGRTQMEISCIRGLVAISGLFSAYYMKQDAVFQSLASFVFSSDESTWQDAFACELVRQHPEWRLPPILFLSAQYDHGLMPQTRELYHLVREQRQSPKLDWITVQDTNHFSVFYFWGAQHFAVLDRILAFLELPIHPIL
jgi:acetyl esterase/lipase